MKRIGEKDMLHFTCQGCGTAFHVPDHFASRRGRCKICSTIVRAPQHKSVRELVGSVNDGESYSPPPTPAQQKNAARESAPAARDPHRPLLPMRTRRLISDAQLIEQALQSFPLIKIRSTQGSPPETYQIEYNIKGLVRGKGGKLEMRDSHIVEIQLTSDYPRSAPKCKMNTPIFHPNIDPAHICVGDYWTAGERLIDLIVRIGEMISFQAYNIKSPLDAEAAMWADLNREKLPVDGRDVRPPNMP